MFWFRLAAHLGMTVREAQARITSPEFSEWIAYNRLDPIGSERDDVRTAMLATLIANAWCRGKGQPPFHVDDFMPKWDNTPERADPADIALKMRQFASQHNALLGAKDDNRRTGR